MKFLFGIGVGLLLSVGGFLLISNQLPQTEKKADIPHFYSIPRIPDSVRFANELVPLTEYEIITRLERELLSNSYFHSNTLQIIQRAHRYFPIIEQVLRQHQIPEDFKYLMVAESGMKNVVSPAGAAGFWQIMKGTARERGLTVNKQIDERYNWLKSTTAAAEYIQQLYQRFDSWTLAAAAYNVGPNAVAKFLSKQNVSDYWNLYLPEETMRYVPRIIALKSILENPLQYGFKVDEDQLHDVYNVTHNEITAKRINWIQYAKSQSVSYKTLKLYNPWIKKETFSSRKPVRFNIALPNTERI